MSFDDIALPGAFIIGVLVGFVAFARLFRLVLEYLKQHID